MKIRAKDVKLEATSVSWKVESLGRRLSECLVFAFALLCDSPFPQSVFFQWAATIRYGENGHPLVSLGFEFTGASCIGVFLYSRRSGGISYPTPLRSLHFTFHLVLAD